MVNPYIAGLIRKPGNQIVHFPAPISPMVGWSGENGGIKTGFKGKLDYQGRFWTLVVDSITNPTSMALVRITWDEVGQTYTIRYKTLPGFTVGLDTYAFPSPNQLTIDANGNIFFPVGTMGLSASYDTYVVAKITAAQFDSADPLDETIYTKVQHLTLNFVGTFGVSLNKAHTRVIFAVKAIDTENSYITELNTTTMAEVGSHAYTLASENAQEFVQNIETNVSGNPSDDLASFCYMETQALAAFRWYMFYKFGTGLVGGAGCEDDAEKCVAFDRLGNLWTTERTTHCPDATNPLRKYVQNTVPIPNPGDYLYSSVTNMTCVVPITPPPAGPGGNTANMSAVTHFDFRRVNNIPYVASGFGPASGDFREEAQTQMCRDDEANYYYSFAATNRETTTAGR